DRCSIILKSSQRDSTTSGTPASRRLLLPDPRLLDEAPGGRGSAPADQRDAAAAFERLVRREERLDLPPPVAWEVVELADLVEARVANRHAEDLLVGPLLVAHEQRADRARRQDAARERRLLDDHERVERVAVSRERVGDEAVVGRIMHRGEQHAIEPDAAGRLVELVLGARALR